jgi:pyrimidine-nucleoside phosphorylase
VLGGGRRKGRLTELTLLLAARAQESVFDVQHDQARAAAEKALGSGMALDRFRLMVEAQGGDPRVVDDPWSVLTRAPVVVPLNAWTAGTLSQVDAEEIGRAAADLGAGRKAKGDPVDPSVGIVLRVKIGDPIDPTEPLGEIHARDRDQAARAAERVLTALAITEGAVEPPPLVYGWRDG